MVLSNILFNKRLVKYIQALKVSQRREFSSGRSEFQRERAEGMKELRKDVVLEWGTTRLRGCMVVVGGSEGIGSVQIHLGKRAGSREIFWR